MRNFKKKSIASDEETKEFQEQLEKDFTEMFKEFKKKNKELMQVREGAACLCST